jgi:hypothetical protein
MKHLFLRSALSLMFVLGITSCVENEPKPAGPVSESSQIPWNVPIAGQGQGQFGALPQNQFRR